MSIYAIGDLHLSSNDKKPMDIFGWINHKEKIFESWKTLVKEDDIVIIAGDTSWALKFEEAMLDLDEIAKLKGKKIIIKGNHDYWWQSLAKMKKSYPGIEFLHNNHVIINNYIFYGTRGWICPNDTKFTSEDQKIYKREIERLKYSLASYKGDTSDLTKIVVMHYPPVNDRHEDSEVLSILKEHEIEHMIYGHLHGEESFNSVYEGCFNETNFHLVSCDYLNFKLKKICD
ncbi:MAG: metallophosphoesterase [Proteocatella sp.]